LIYEQPLPSTLEWQGELPATADGQVTAVSLMTRAVLTVRVEQRDTIDWYLQRLLMPLEQPVAVRKDDCLRISFSYPAGAPLDALAETLRVSAFARSAPRSPHPAQARTE
jgi:hypothetical protein